MGASLQYLDPDLRQGLQELTQLCGQNRIVLTVTSTVRSTRDQNFLYDRYTKGQSVLPAAPPGHSAHEYGWAFDAVVAPRNYQNAVGQAWVNYWGGAWGGTRDPVHFELPGASQLAWKIGEEGAPAPAAPDPGITAEDAPVILKMADFVSGLSPLGYVQMADTLANFVAPGTGKYDRILSALINHPFSEVYAFAKNL